MCTPSILKIDEQLAFNTLLSKSAAIITEFLQLPVAMLPCTWYAHSRSQK